MFPFDPPENIRKPLEFLKSVIKFWNKEVFRYRNYSVFEKGVTVVVLEICLSGKALIEVECNFKIADTKEIAIL